MSITLRLRASYAKNVLPELSSDTSRRANLAGAFSRAPKAKIAKLHETDNGQLAAALGAYFARASAPLRVDVDVIWLVAARADSLSVALLEQNLGKRVAVERGNSSSRRYHIR